MRIVVPVSRSDLHLLPQWVELHEFHKVSGLNHQLFIVVPRTIASDAMDAKARLDPLFESVAIHQLDHEPYGGHPKAPNMHFYECAALMARHNEGVPWQLVELDCLLTKANGYDVIASKYGSSGVPFFGAVSKTPWRETEMMIESGKDAQGRPVFAPNPRYGNITRSPFGDADVIVSGCAVYPGNMIKRPNFAGLMQDFMKGSDSPDEAWDIYLRAAMSADGFVDTNLIASMWNTCNYRVENGALMCDPMPSHEVFERNPTWAHRQCGGQVHPDAVLIHGCKDDSLFKLITEGKTPTVYVPAPQAAAAPAQTYDSQRIDALEKKFDEGFLAIKELLQRRAEAPDAKKINICATNEPDTIESLIERVSKLVPEGKSMRLNDLANALSVDTPDLRKQIESSADFIIKGPSNWVQRRAA